MRIVHLSDIHIGTDDARTLGSLIETVRALAPDLVVASGDFTMAGRHAEFRAAARVIERFNTTVLATPGNHDLPVYDPIERFTAPFARYRRYIGAISTDRFTSDDAAILALNSARRWDLSFNWSHGRLSAPQIAAADRFFARAQHARFRALVVHHPFYVPEELPGFKQIGGAEEMLDVLASRGVHAVLSGHLHQQCVTTRSLKVSEDHRTITLLQVASAASTRRRDQPNAFSLLEIRRDGVYISEFVAGEDGFQPGQPRRVIPIPKDDTREPEERTQQADSRQGATAWTS